MAYRVIKAFTDLQDDSFKYNVGDKFPRNGKTVTDDRIKKLASNANRQGVPLIAEDKNKDNLNPAFPAQSERAERETPFEGVMNEPKEPVAESVKSEEQIREYKPKRAYNRKKKDG